MYELPREVREGDRAARADKSGVVLGWVAEGEVHHGLQAQYLSGYSCAVVALHHMELPKLHSLQNICKPNNLDQSCTCMHRLGSGTPAAAIVDA
jgi:hypothetical protein